MNRLFVVTLLLFGLLFPALAQDVKRKPEDLTITLAWIADAGEPKQYIFVINGIVAYKTTGGLRDYLKDLPKDSKLTWISGCRRFGNEQFLSSQGEIKRFKEFCESIGIKFVLIPSG